MSRPRNVLFVSAECRGNDRLLNSMVRRLPDHGFRARSIYLFDPPDGRNDLDRDERSNYLQLPRSKGFNARAYRAIVRLVNAERPDVVHGYRHTLLPYLALVRRAMPNFGLVMHLHGLRRVRGIGRKMYYAAFAGHVSKFITVSEAARRDLCARAWGDLESRTKKIWNGIELDRIDAVSDSRDRIRDELRIPRKAFVIGTVGRLAETKGQAFLLGALAQVLKERAEAWLVLAGEGPLEAKLRSEAEALGISSRVSFLGFREDVPRVLRSFDLFAFPSIAEGLGLALLEAMGSRLPVVASHVGGIPEVFGEAEIGRLVPPGDASALSSAILDLAQRKRREMGSIARQRVEREFSAEVMTTALAEVYREIIG